jgi:5-formyltetrahydrofolate cyclo-ligase
MIIEKSEKDRLRSVYKKILKSIQNQEFRSDQICSKIISDIRFQESQSILLYYPLPNEVNIKRVLELSWAKGKKVYLPFFKKIAIGEVQSYKDLLNEGQIKIPKKQVRLEYLSKHFPFNLVLVPGIAFDADGYRLGHGGAWYDNLLKILKHNNCVNILGVCFKEQLTEKLPREIHDVKLDDVISA